MPFLPSLPFESLFPPLPPPPPRPNTDPRCNTPPSSHASLPHVISSLNLRAWEHYLRDYPDPAFVSTILHIIQHGASIGFNGDQHPQTCTNLKSTLEAPETINADIAAQLANGRAHGPFTSSPLPNFRCSPLGSVTKKRSLKRRRIHHLSWPPGDSVNDGIPDTEGTIQYELYRDAIATVRSLGQGTLLAKLDLKDAFRQIPVRPLDWNLLGYQWLGKIYYDIVLAFGLKSAPYIFNLFAEALHWIISRHLPAELKHYLDDFLAAFRSSTPIHIANAAVSWMLGLGHALGLEFQAEKTVWPTTSLEFLGLWLDTIKMEARLPEDELTFLRDLLTSWTRRSQCTLRELQELNGFLQFSSQVIPSSRAFIRRLIDFSTTFPNSFSKRHIPSSARRDIHWWLTYSSSWNGVYIIRQSTPTLHVYTDASGLKGMGGIFGNQWFSSRIARRHRHQHIQIKEIAAVLEAILRWGNQFRGCHVIFHGDNDAIVSALSNSSIRCTVSMGFLRTIIMLAACLDFTFSSEWLSTDDNALADAASRFQYARLFTLAPHLNRKPSSKDPQINGIKHMLTSRGKLHFTSGTVSPPPPVKHTPLDKRASFGLQPHKASGILTDHSFRHLNQQSWNGFRISEDQSSGQPKTIKAYLCHLRSLHVDCDLPFTATEHPVVQRLIRGIKRYHGEKDRKPKLSITLPVLQDVVAALRPGVHPDDDTYDAAFKLAYSAFLRCGEFTVPKNDKFSPETDLTRRCVEFIPSIDAPTHIRLTLPHSKTDPFRKGITILIAAAPDTTTCAVTALQHLFQTRQLPPNSPLFTTGQNNLPLTRKEFIQRLQVCLLYKGYDATAYSGHSFRRGAASSAALAGFSEHEIQLLGRWRSDAYKLYIDVPSNLLLHLSSLLHWVQPSATPFEPPSLLVAPPLA